MDNCQPIYIETQQGDDFFLLIVEDRDLVKKNDPEPYYYVHNWGITQPQQYFSSPEDAYVHAIRTFDAGDNGDISSAHSMGMHDFLTDQELRNRI